MNTIPLLVLFFATGVQGLRLNVTSEKTVFQQEVEHVTQRAASHCIPGIPNPGINLAPLYPVTITNQYEVCDGDVHFIPIMPHGFKPRSPSNITKAFFIALAAVLGCAILGKVWEYQSGTKSDRMQVSRTYLCFILGCYAVFIPGIILPVVEIDLRIHVAAPDWLQYGSFGMVKTLGLPAFMLPQGLMVESMWTLIQTLWGLPGCKVASIAIAVYSLVVPGVKLICFGVIYAMTKQTDIRESEAKKRWLERLVEATRFISKYDSPKLFIYLVMKMTFDGLHSPPGLTSESWIDVGFVLYAIFCVGTLLACIMHHDFGESSTKYGKTWMRVAELPKRPSSKWGLAGFTTVAMAVFIILFLVGSNLPLCSLNLGIPGFERHVTFSLFGCVGHYFQHLSIVDINPLICLILLLIFCTVFPILHMCGYCVAAWCRMSKQENAREVVASALWWTEIFGYLEMLDVFIIGVIGMFVQSGAAFSMAGVSMGIHIGCFVLAVAEFWLYVCSWYLSGDGAFYTESPNKKFQDGPNNFETVGDQVNS